MGQKVNPHGMRVGVIKDWDSRWFTSKQAFGDTLVEDYKIRKTLKKQLYAAGVPKIEIERTVDSQTGAPRVKVNVFCAKPGIVIGANGANIEKIKADGCRRRTGLLCDITVNASLIQHSSDLKALFHGTQLTDGAEILKKVAALLQRVQMQDCLKQTIHGFSPEFVVHPFRLPH